MAEEKQLFNPANLEKGVRRLLAENADLINNINESFDIKITPDLILHEILESNANGGARNQYDGGKIKRTHKELFGRIYMRFMLWPALVERFGEKEGHELFGKILAAFMGKAKAPK